MNLQKWAFGGVMITTVMIGITAFIATGTANYGVTDNVDQGQLDKLENIEDSTSIARDAQDRAEQAEARSNFFTLPNIVNLLRLPFESVPIWEAFLGMAMNFIGLSAAPGNWPMLMASAFILIAISFRFAGRVL